MYTVPGKVVTELIRLEALGDEVLGCVVLCCMLRRRTLRSLSSIQPVAEWIPFPGVYHAS
jgi:hypothetical protein